MHQLSSIILGVLVLSAGFYSLPAEAQRTPPAPPSLSDGPLRTSPVDTQISALFQLADQYLRSDQIDRAVALMEDLYADEPASLPVVTKLKQVYTAARQFDNIVTLVEQRIEREGPSMNLYAELGMALHHAGRTEEALEAWTSAVSAAPNAEMTYRIVANHMGQARLYENAASALLHGREHLGDSLLYRAELANLYGHAANYEAAAAEYLALLTDNPDSANLVRARLTRLIDAEGAVDAFSAAVARAVRQNPLNRAYRELAAWIALERGDFWAALDANIAIDRLQGEQGQSLFGFAEAAVTADAFEEARRALTIIVERHGNGPIASHAYFALAQLSEKLAEQSGENAFDAGGQRIPAPHYEAALESYSTFAERFPRHPSAGEALARAAELQQTVFRDYAAAEEILRTLVAGSNNPSISGNARLDLGRVSLRRGNLAAARMSFTQVEEGLRIGPIAESARLELARLDFYEGDFDGALARADAMNQNTATNAANDAISLKLLVRENTGPDSLSEPLHAYAHAALLLRQQRSGEALGALDELLASVGAHPISDEAAFLRIEALRALQRPDDALVALSGFGTRYPDSHLVERTVFLRGEVYERDLSDTAAATAAYADLLVRFPGSLLAPEARSRLRRLRGDRPPG